MTSVADSQTGLINGIDTKAIAQLVTDIREDHAQGIASFRVITSWKRGMQSETHVDGWTLGGRRLAKDFNIHIDEPRELCGRDEFPNPQEYLLAAMNACMLNTFVAACSLMDVTIESLEFASEGTLDLRGFLGMDDAVSPGYDELRYAIRVKGDGTAEQFQKAHDAMKATSPNYFNMAQSIALRSELVVE